MTAQRRAIYAGYGSRELCVDGDGPTTLLFHGAAHCSESWRPVLSRYELIGHPAVAMDLPGFGQADPLRDGCRLAQLDQFVADAVSQHAAVAPVVLVGNALGGLLALRAAESSRALPIAGIVALDPVGTGHGSPIRPFIIHHTVATILRASLAMPSAIRHVAVSFLARVLQYGRMNATDSTTTRKSTQHVRTGRGMRQFLASVLPISAELRTLEPPSDIQCPTVIMHGGNDRIASVRNSRLLHESIPHSRLVLLPRSGHCPQLDAPERVARLAIELATARIEDRSESTGPAAI